MGARYFGAEATSKKALAASMLSQGASQIDTANAVGVTAKTIRRWYKQPEFCEAVYEMTTAVIKESLPDILNVLVEHSKTGSHQHIKLLLEHLHYIDNKLAHAPQGEIQFKWGK